MMKFLIVALAVLAVVFAAEEVKDKRDIAYTGLGYSGVPLAYNGLGAYSGVSGYPYGYSGLNYPGYGYGYGYNGLLNGGYLGAARYY